MMATLKYIALWDYETADGVKVKEGQEISLSPEAAYELLNQRKIMLKEQYEMRNPKPVVEKKAVKEKDK